MAPVLDYWLSAGRDTLGQVAGIRPIERQSSLNQYPIHKPATRADPAKFFLSERIRFVGKLQQHLLVIIANDTIF